LVRTLDESLWLSRFYSARFLPGGLASSRQRSHWQLDVTQLAWRDQGRRSTLQNVRNCDYRTETDYTPHWETRTVRLSQITGSISRPRSDHTEHSLLLASARWRSKLRGIRKLIPSATRFLLMKTNAVVVERVTTDSKLFAPHALGRGPSRWPAFYTCAYFLRMFYLFPRVPLWVMIILGLIYSVSISWNINGISHNFIHNPYFRSPVLNRLFSILESITVGFSQIFYECIHMQHHKGNADLPDEHGETVDWISIYKHGHDGDAEHPFKYAFFSFFREDPKTVFKELKRKDPREAFWGVLELHAFRHDRSSFSAF
jgi:hypothetical protein